MMIKAMYKLRNSYRQLNRYRYNVTFFGVIQSHLKRLHNITFEHFPRYLSVVTDRPGDRDIHYELTNVLVNCLVIIYSFCNNIMHTSTKA